MTTSKVAVVTGSGKKRVGNSIARALAQAGYDIAIHYHQSESAAAESVEEMKREGVDAIAVQADLADEHQVTGMLANILSQFGRVDVLVNSAAIWERRALEDVTAADVRRHFEVNTLGTFLCSQRLGLEMVKQPEGGSIVLIGDWAIDRPYRGYSAYFPSKGAIPAMTRSLAVELGARNPRVRVNCIHPGPVMLPEGMPESERARVVALTLVKRQGSPSHVADAVLFLVRNEFVTGGCIAVDGGRTIYAGDDM